MRNPRHFSSFLAACALFPGALFSQSSVQIDWGTSTQQEKIITSDGSAVSISEFKVELGGFAGGFVPDQNNTNDWISNWRVFDAVTDPDSDTNGPGGSTADGFISGGGTDARFVGTGHLLSDGTSASEDYTTGTFAAGQQAYVFIRDKDSLLGGAEWLLYTSTSGISWQYPVVTGGQTQLPNPWFVSEADTAVWGGVNGTINGGGDYTDTSTDFVLRTHFVPEPGVSMLMLVGVGLLFRRNRS